MKKSGFTLVELLISFTILTLLSIAMFSVFNSIGEINNGKDAQRKEDLRKIKIAFEEYFNDKGYYPQDVNSWNIKLNCYSTNISFSQYLSPWPCDPNGEPYEIVVEVNKFKIMTNLENKNDRDISVQQNGFNYGVSSSNILWYDQ